MSKRAIAKLLALALAATWSVGMYAQDSGQNAGQMGQGQMGQGRMGGMRGPMSPQMQLDRMTKQLDLTKDEQDKIKPILEDQQKQMEDLRNDTSTDREARMDKMRDIHKSHAEQIRNVLTTEQQTKFDEMQKQMMERGRRGMGGQNGGTPPPPPQ